MWIFTNFGFVSAVQHKDKKGVLVVRSREPGVIEKLCDRHDVKAAVKKTPFADYLYRAEIEKPVFSKMIADEILSIDYPNFKNAFKAAVPENTMTSYLALLDVWRVMNRLQCDIDTGDIYTSKVPVEDEDAWNSDNVMAAIGESLGGDMSDIADMFDMSIDENGKVVG